MRTALFLRFARMSAVAERFRPDGVKILHDPYAPGMVEKYGRPGETDNEGFDPYADTVGPGTPKTTRGSVCDSHDHFWGRSR